MNADVAESATYYSTKREPSERAGIYGGDCYAANNPKHYAMERADFGATLIIDEHQISGQNQKHEYCGATSNIR